ncbi:MAG: MFS transporter, partial [Hamadaea sp.]|uniref:MFS transporter n=1 Tax=Hamadaea sp. TaxID=2024425 RepID=UPI0017EDC972
LAIAVWVESRAAQPVVPLQIIRRRTPALSIIASLAVGMAMFGGAVFLGQYFQIGRGYSPTEAGLLTIPMMAGVLVSSTVTGRLISRSGTIKRFIVAGTIVLIAGFVVLSTIDHETPLGLVGLGMALVGIGVGMTMQNLVLAVQNDVPLHEMGAASASVTFFRSLGGTVGVSVLGAVLANRVTDNIMENLAKAGIPATSTGKTSALNLNALPEAFQHIVRAAYGDATGHIFLISAAIAVVGLIAAIAFKPITLRTTIDLGAKPSDSASGSTSASASGSASAEGSASASASGDGSASGEKVATRQ